jgi:ArsR family transcriptional regulator
METETPVRRRPVIAGFKRMARVLRVVADERRLRILGALMGRELCVCELVDTLLLPQYDVSRHLGRLKQVGLVVDRREGLWAYYSIPEAAWQDSLLGGFLGLVRREGKGTRQGRADSARLEQRLAMRSGNRCVVGFQK